MSDYQYKEDIMSSRKGCLGGSDARMLMGIAEGGEVPKSAYKRLAVCKGLIEQDNVTTSAMRLGDDVENGIYELISSQVPGLQSNPVLESRMYSQKNVKLIAHPDFYIEDDDTKTISVYECKATKYPVRDTRLTYKAQMFVEMSLARERAEELGKMWRVKMYLVHYDTTGIDLESGFEGIDPKRLTVSEVRFNNPVFDIKRGMEIVSKFLVGFNEYVEGDVIAEQYLPEDVRGEFNLMAEALKLIKEKEKMIDDFKTKLYDFMQKKGVKSVKSDLFTISVVEPTVVRAFDSKRYLEDFAAKHPQKARKIKKQYEKVTNKKGYINFKLKDNEQPKNE